MNASKCGLLGLGLVLACFLVSSLKATDYQFTCKTVQHGCGPVGGPCHPVPINNPTEWWKCEDNPVDVDACASSTNLVDQNKSCSENNNTIHCGDGRSYTDSNCTQGASTLRECRTFKVDAVGSNCGED